MTALLLACSAGEQSLASARASGGASAAGTAGSVGAAGLGGSSGGSEVIVPIAGTGGAVVDPSCAQATYGAELEPLTLYILLDQSGSMKEFDDRWTPVTSALQAFVNAPASQGCAWPCSTSRSATRTKRSA